MFGKYVKGAGGMPVGTAGKGMLLLSGGIDSPVAGYMIAKRGMKIDAIHFHSYPYTNLQAREKVEELARILSEYTCGCSCMWSALRISRRRYTGFALRR